MSEGHLQSIVKFDNVVKNYKSVQALKGVSFEVKKGNIFGYIGPNGAGKTTSMKILVGLITDFKGNVEIEGKDIRNLDEFGKKIGYLPQNVGFHEWRSVEEILITFGLLSGMAKAELKERIPQVLDLVNLIEFRKRKIKHLSGGMQQKLKLAQALLHNPSILILDEPLDGLDPTSRWQLKNTIKQLAREDITIIFSSHILQDVEDIADVIGIIKDGRILKIGSPKDLQQEQIGGNAVQIIGVAINKWINQMETLPEVAKVEMDSTNPERLIIHLRSEVKLEKCLLRLMDFFSENKIVIQNFVYLKPSLEQVYLKYITGGNSS